MPENVRVAVTVALESASIAWVFCRQARKNTHRAPVWLSGGYQTALVPSLYLVNEEDRRIHWCLKTTKQPQDREATLVKKSKVAQSHLDNTFQSC